ncbi:hypothetical protein MKEN_00714900 [Mycena kentingensis (nom. inval.)]|nr:hypothetical protein MKEN_00714900 [Mycena kentingensis (nom. inval.)]
MAAGEQRTRHRKPQGASCDNCRRRKIRCDSVQVPGNQCSHCLRGGLDCTHADIFKTMSSAKSYVSALEHRVEKLEGLLSKLLPGIDFEHLDNDTDVEGLLLGRPLECLPRNDADSIARTLSKLKLDPDTNRFFGKSSGVQLVQVALNFGQQLKGQPVHTSPAFAPKRGHFWQPAQWIFPPPGDDSPKYTFPSPDLLASLVDLYFQEVNPYNPVIHQPTFRAQVADLLHLRDHRFAATLLMVCSLGSRYSSSPDVLLDTFAFSASPPPSPTSPNDDGSSLRHTAGWKWHNQVRVLPKNLIYKPDLYELQTIALSSLFLLGMSSTAMAWNQLGFGLRRAVDVGAHRQRRQAEPSAENEQWKRVFSVLLCLEWEMSAQLGRPITMHEQDFDQELPLECDDEYWGSAKFMQPSGKPSQMSYFIWLIKLLEIQAAVTTNIYRTRKPRDFSGQASTPTDAQSIMEFDSALNGWLSSLPGHLRWGPDRTDRVFFQQSAVLHAKYHYIQILLHRPFIPTPLVPSPAAGVLPSLAICTNAARSCVRILETLVKRDVVLTPFLLSTAFTSGIMLLLNIWSGRRSVPISSLALEQVHACMALTRSGERLYLTAGRYTDILERLMDTHGLDALLDHRGPSFPAVPPAAQPGYEPAPCPELFTADKPFAELSGPGGDMAFDAPFMASELESDSFMTWSSAPSGFSLDDWSYVMEPIPVPGPVPPVDELRMRRALCGFWN